MLIFNLTLQRTIVKLGFCTKSSYHVLPTIIFIPRFDKRIKIMWHTQSKNTEFIWNDRYSSIHVHFKKIILLHYIFDMKSLFGLKDNCNTWEYPIFKVATWNWFTLDELVNIMLNWQFIESIYSISSPKRFCFVETCLKHHLPCHIPFQHG